MWKTHQNFIVFLLSFDYDFEIRMITRVYESFATVGEIRVWWRADFQSGSRVLKKVF